MTEEQRGSAFSSGLEGGSGTVPAEVREMLDGHSMTKTDGPKKQGQLNMSPLSEEGAKVVVGVAGISSTLSCKM